MRTTIPIPFYEGPSRILLRVPAQRPIIGKRAKISISHGTAELAPLFPSQADPKFPGLARAHHWYAAPIGRGDETREQLWDAAHEIVTNGARDKEAGSTFAEPDIPQTWLYENRVSRTEGLMGAAPGELCAFHPEDPAFPHSEPPTFAWHLGDGYSQLKAAREAAQAGASQVCIAILDTGFDFAHPACPRYVLRDLARNFVDDGRGPRQVEDPYERGLLNNPGHGTGTIGLLAGRCFDPNWPGIAFNTAIGGAPDARIIPLRVATSVILFRTSSIAQALDYVLAPGGDPGQRPHVVSLSMGGLASRLWADAVNRAYEAGIVLVAAAGNNLPGSPSHTVFPARFHRVIAACGVMRDGMPYLRAYVPSGRMAGNCGPNSVMETALSAYTPNTPWAEINCKHVDMDGAGTSSATPQIAAAAALWLQKYRAKLPYDAPWKTVEAVRHALFSSAAKNARYKSAELGQGTLRALACLEVPPLEAPTMTPPDSADFALIRGVFGLPLAPRPQAETEMLELELAQVIQSDAQLAKCAADAEGVVGSELEHRRCDLIDELVCRAALSTKLTEALKSAYPPKYGTAPGPRSAGHLPELPAIIPHVPSNPPPRRRFLRGYAFDPQLSAELATAAMNEIVYDIRWEENLKPGPCGHYIDVVDLDPATGGFYPPVDLDDKHVLASNGLEPSEGNPYFHQQMVYSVAMTTIEHFEAALGRRVLWAPRLDGVDDHEYVPRLRIYPHALRQDNSYYDPQRKALLFGYFPAEASEPGKVYPGSTVFTCLSQDIVAHETTHAILDGMHRSLLTASNVDSLAFHEAFADLVALFQHFSLPGVLREQIATERGNLRTRNLLGELAVQFGTATGRFGALRSAIGEIDPKTKQWKPIVPDPSRMRITREPHARGSILVAAVFDAFLKLHEKRSADLLRIASGGTGVLPEGALHPDLVARLAAEAAKTAKHLLRMCVRALDYCPPVHLQFGDFLRALITADREVETKDELGYRVALVETFRARGIYPKGLRSFSVDTLPWNPPGSLTQELLGPKLHKILLPHGNEYANLDAMKLPEAREQIFHRLRDWRIELHRDLRKFFGCLDDQRLGKVADEMGLDLQPGFASFEVRSLQFSRRTVDGRAASTRALISLIQERREDPHGDPFIFRGGCTIILDLGTGLIDYLVRKKMRNTSRVDEAQQYHAESRIGLANLYFGDIRDGSDASRQLARLHSLDKDADHGY